MYISSAFVSSKLQFNDKKENKKAGQHVEIYYIRPSFRDTFPIFRATGIHRKMKDIRFNKS